uniref:PAS domain-containing protein n=1 Tax=Tetranychus urticae TaxID=32264 RepID=T1JR31_TETUR
MLLALRMELAKLNFQYLHGICDKLVGEFVIITDSDGSIIYASRTIESYLDMSWAEVFSEELWNRSLHMWNSLTK